MPVLKKDGSHPDHSFWDVTLHRFEKKPLRMFVCLSMQIHLIVRAFQFLREWMLGRSLTHSFKHRPPFKHQHLQTFGNNAGKASLSRRDADLSDLLDAFLTFKLGVGSGRLAHLFNNDRTPTSC